MMEKLVPEWTFLPLLKHTHVPLLKIQTPLSLWEVWDVNLLEQLLALPYIIYP